MDADAPTPGDMDRTRMRLSLLALSQLHPSQHSLEDPDDDSDNSSSDSSSSSIISTRSLHSDDLTAVEENGRHYPDDQYFQPSDLQEATRLSIVHRVYTAALGGESTTVPLSHNGTTNPTGAGLSILDVGTGPGDWAIAVQERFPDADVVAVDVGIWPEFDSDGPLESAAARASVQWEIDNLDARPAGWEPGSKTVAHEERAGSTPRPPSPSALENPWTFSTKFDLIHMRGMKGVFSHWPSIYRSAYACLAPGGWIEVADYEFDRDEVVEEVFTPERGSSGSRLLDLFQVLRMTMREIGRPLDMSHMQPSVLEAAGFVDVWTKVVDIPVGGGSGNGVKDGKGKGKNKTTSAAREADERQRAAGKLWFVGIMEACEAMTLRPLTRYAGWSTEEVLKACEAARAELTGGVLDGVRTPFLFVRGRKPFNEI